MAAWSRSMKPSGSSSPSYGWEPLACLLDDGLAECVERHWREVGVHMDDVPLACDWDKYEDLERKGILRVIAARRGSELVGYASFMVMPHLHYSTTLHAMNDAIWVQPERRGIGIGLIKAAERALREVAKERGYDRVRVLYRAKLHVEAERGTLGPVFERLGYRAFETEYDKIVR